MEIRLRPFHKDTKGAHLWSQDFLVDTGDELSKLGYHVTLASLPELEERRDLTWHCLSVSITYTQTKQLENVFFFHISSILHWIQLRDWFSLNVDYRQSTNAKCRVTES